MTESKTAATRRLARLERLLAGRHAQLTARLTRPAKPAFAARPLATLQERGYSVALVLAATALLPAVLAFAFKRRKLIVRTAANRVGIGKWQSRLDEGRLWGDGR